MAYGPVGPLGGAGLSSGFLKLFISANMAYGPPGGFGA